MRAQQLRRRECGPRGEESRRVGCVAVAAEGSEDEVGEGAGGCGGGGEDGGAGEGECEGGRDALEGVWGCAEGDEGEGGGGPWRGL